MNKKIKDKLLFLTGIVLLIVGLWYSLVIIVILGAIVAILQIKNAPIPKISVVKTIEMEDFLKANQEVINQSVALVIEAAKKEFLEETPNSSVGEFYQKLQEATKKDEFVVLKMATNYGIGKGWLKLK